jgi:hypothetical protein
MASQLFLVKLLRLYLNISTLIVIGSFAHCDYEDTAVVDRIDSLQHLLIMMDNCKPLN